MADTRLRTALADRYLVERELGSGGMATVYLATDLKHGRRVAIKVLHPELAVSIGADRFLREIRIAAGLTHPHIMPLHDSGSVEEFLYYVMPYVAGETLRDRMDRLKQLPMGEAAQIAREVADALAAAHRHGIVHRDIKPENILLAEGHAVVSDFGIARAVTRAGDEGLTATGITVGTPAYMSPEQATGEQDLDGRSDVYSLGCVLYEMLAGTAPFTAGTARALIARHLVDPVPQLRTVRPGIAAAVEAAVMKALAKAPADRFATAGEFAAALTADVPVGLPVPDNLPTFATRFIGREREQEQLLAILREHRLVTLQGPGGCGKTRLAIEAARRAASMYPDGVWFAGLAQLTSQAMVGNALAEALQVTPEKDRPIEYTIAHRIAQRRMLVVLDNCEHVVDECARILETLVTHTEAPRFLATSREPVKFAGEAVFPTPSLSCPAEGASASDVAASDSVALFRDRALLSDPGFLLDDRNARHVVAVCRKLDGIPLAIEMAASRVRVMSLETMVERLSDQLRVLSSGTRTAPPRHQTLRATIEWSSNLLTNAERTLFHRLSVFAGDFDLMDAEAVGGFEPLSRSETLDLLTQLLDKSLVVRVEADSGVRYALLEVVKQYGRERLAAQHELAELERRYCDFYLATARAAYRKRLTHAARWLGWVSAELYNLQGAFTLLADDPERRIELAGLLGEYLFLLGRLGVGREILMSALQDYEVGDIPRARALGALGFLEVWFLDFETGCQQIAESMTIARRSGTARDQADLYWLGGTTETIRQRWDEARAILEEGRRLAQQQADPWLCVRYQWSLNWIAVSQLRPDLIEDDVQACLDEAVRCGHPFDITASRHMYADVPLQQGAFQLSEVRYIDAAKSALAMQNTLQAIIEMQGIAMSVAGQGRHAKGLRLFGASVAKFEELGAHMVKLGFWTTCIQRTVGRAAEAVGPERARELDEEGRRMGWDHALKYAFDTDRD